MNKTQQKEYERDRRKKLSKGALGLSQDVIHGREKHEFYFTYRGKKFPPKKHKSKRVIEPYANEGPTFSTQYETSNLMAKEDTSKMIEDLRDYQLKLKNIEEKRFEVIHQRDEVLSKLLFEVKASPAAIRTLVPSLSKTVLKNLKQRLQKNLTKE